MIICDHGHAHTTANAGYTYIYIKARILYKQWQSNMVNNQEMSEKERN